MKESENPPKDILSVLMEIAERTIGADLVPVEAAKYEYDPNKILEIKEYTDIKPLDEDIFTTPTEEEIEKVKNLLAERGWSRQYLNEWSYEKNTKDGTIHASTPQTSWLTLRGRLFNVNLLDNSIKTLMMS